MWKRVKYRLLAIRDCIFMPNVIVVSINEEKEKIRLYRDFRLFDPNPLLNTLNKIMEEIVKSYDDRGE